MDRCTANFSTVTKDRIFCFGRTPNRKYDPHGRCHAKPAWLDMMESNDPPDRGRKLVVQMIENFQSGSAPAFVETLEAVDQTKESGMPLAPVMIYGDDVSHKEDIAYLYRAKSLEERKEIVAAAPVLQESASKLIRLRFNICERKTRSLSQKTWAYTIPKPNVRYWPPVALPICLNARAVSIICHLQDNIANQQEQETHHGTNHTGMYRQPETGRQGTCWHREFRRSESSF